MILPGRRVPQLKLPKLFDKLPPGSMSILFLKKCLTRAGGSGSPTHSVKGQRLEFRENLKTLLADVDESIEETRDLGRYLGQIAPLAKDGALAKSAGVRIMTLAGSKGLTVEAAILCGLEAGLVPMDGADLAEERRLLYVGMTRARKFLFGTWAQTRRGPTARAGRGQVNARRQPSFFLDGGPVPTQNGHHYLATE